MRLDIFRQQEALAVGAGHRDLVALADIAQVVAAHAQEQPVMGGIVGGFPGPVLVDQPFRRRGNQVAAAVFAPARAGHRVESYLVGPAALIATGSRLRRKTARPGSCRASGVPETSSTRCFDVTGRLAVHAQFIGNDPTGFAGALGRIRFIRTSGSVGA